MTAIRPRYENQVQIVLPDIPLRKKILLCIWVLATPDSFRSVADRFGMGKGNAAVCFKQIAGILAAMLPIYIQWPNEMEIMQIKAVSIIFVLF